MSNLIKKITSILFSGSERTKIVKKNIYGSFIVKGLSIILAFFLVPLTLNLINQEKYGIWITVVSIVSWFNMMDIGLGWGFRNKFGEAVGTNNTPLAKEYVQTLYSSIGLVSILFLIIYTLIHPFLNWTSILNISPGFDENIQLIVWCIFVLFCVQLYLRNLGTILLSLQKTSFNNATGLASGILSLVLIYLLKVFHCANLFTISMAFMSSNVILGVGLTIYLFRTSLKQYAPKFLMLPKKENLRELMGLSIKFFFIQITTMVMFSSANIVIAQLFGPKEVTPYQISYRLFANAQVAFTIITTPFWAAFNEANAKNDIKWITNSINKLVQIWAVYSVGVLLIWILSPYIIDIWVGKQVQVSYSLSFQFALYTIIMAWNAPFVYYITSVSKITLELWIAFIQCFATIPLAIFLAKQMSLGTTGVIMATNIVLLIASVLIPIQYYKLINGNAKGIWNK